jgi:plastocyanin
MTASVKIMNFAFTPSSLSVHTGARVTFTNQDASYTHTVTSDSGLFDSGNLAYRASFSFTFTGKGSFPYHCAIHTNMKGTITVTG